MTATLAIVAAGFAVWLLTGAPRVLAAKTPAQQVSPAVLWASGFGVVCLVLLPITGAVGVGASFVVGAVAWRFWQAQRQARAAKVRGQIAQACRDLAGELRLGKIPSAALAAVGTTGPLRSAVALESVGGDVVALWRAEAQDPGHEMKLTLARAWDISARAGSPMSDALALVAAQVQQDAEREHTMAAELAGPRMTSLVLSCLPVVGVGLGYALGGDPWAFLSGSIIGSVCLVAACALTAAGLVWSELMIRRLERKTGG